MTEARHKRPQLIGVHLRELFKERLHGDRADHWLPGAGGGRGEAGWGGTANEDGASSRGDDSIPELDDMITQPCKYTKMH